jgi:crotonobetainyl-CoA:carnitine CoA-transferase CaiB-like acyl-CoA transferase
MSGIMSFVGHPGGTPASTAVPISDLNAGTFGALGVVAAWAHRQKTGEGQRVEATLLESALVYTVWEAGMYFTLGAIPQPRNQSLWQRFCEATGQAALRDDPRFADAISRVMNREELKVAIEAHLTTDTTAAWLDKLLAQGIPCGPINTIDQALADPQVQARGLIVRMGNRYFIGSPIRMSRTPPGLRRGPAEIGEHSREVLIEAGFSAGEVEDLLASGALLQGAQA